MNAPGKSEIIYNLMGANERALVDNIKNKFFRNVFIRIFGIKLRLQWSGWLQYLIPLPFLFLILIFGEIVYFLGAVPAAKIIFSISLLLTLRIAFDIITIKMRIGPPEKYPDRNDDKNIFDLMRMRYSCRSFQTRKLKDEDFNELMFSLNKRAKGTRLGKKEIRLEYINLPVNVWPTVNASEFIVAIAPREYDRMAVMDVGRMLQKIVIDVTRMGLATCWIGPGADHKSIAAALGNRFDPEDDNVICVCAIGYKSWLTPLFIQIFNKRMHNRLPLASLFFTDFKMKHPLELDRDPFKIFGRTFEACQWAPSSYNGQTTRCVGVKNKDGSLKHFDFYAVTSSRYYAAVATGIWCANWEMGCEALNIKGKFKVLTDNIKNEIPKYDISWILKQ